MSKQDLLALQRKFFAEEIQITSNIRTPGLIDALATVPREHFFGPGPWTIRGEADFQAPPGKTPSDDPRFLYHNVAVAIDETRMLFNGAPGFLAVLVDALGIKPGHRVAHLGTGAGYYTAVLAETVGATGRVSGVEVDAGLAAIAAEKLAAWPNANVLEGDGTELAGGPFDAILINAGVTHVLPGWLDALAPGGRMIVPLTATMGGPLGPAMPNIGKGLVTLITRTGDANVFDVRLVTFVAIYSALGLRDDATNTKIGAALKANPYPHLKQLRMDPHEPAASCWLHDAHGCWSL